MTVYLLPRTAGRRLELLVRVLQLRKLCLEETGYNPGDTVEHRFVSSEAVLTEKKSSDSLLRLGANLSLGSGDPRWV